MKKMLCRLYEEEVSVRRCHRSMKRHKVSVADTRSCSTSCSSLFARAPPVLPDDIWYTICRVLATRDVVALSATSKTFSSLVDRIACDVCPNDNCLTRRTTKILDVDSFVVSDTLVGDLERAYSLSHKWKNLGWGVDLVGHVTLTSQMLPAVSRIRDVNLACCTNITYLTDLLNVKRVCINSCTMVTDVAPLAGALVVDMEDCIGVRDISPLAHVPRLK